jgi:hypothetical protein
MAIITDAIRTRNAAAIRCGKKRFTRKSTMDDRKKRHAARIKARQDACRRTPRTPAGAGRLSAYTEDACRRRTPVGVHRGRLPAQDTCRRTPRTPAGVRYTCSFFHNNLRDSPIDAFPAIYGKVGIVEGEEGEKSVFPYASSHSRLRQCECIAVLQ